MLFLYGFPSMTSDFCPICKKKISYFIRIQGCQSLLVTNNDKVKEVTSSHETFFNNIVNIPVDFVCKYPS